MGATVLTARRRTESCSSLANCSNSGMTYDALSCGSRRSTSVTRLVAAARRTMGVGSWQSDWNQVRMTWRCEAPLSSVYSSGSTEHADVRVVYQWAAVRWSARGTTYSITCAVGMCEATVLSAATAWVRTAASSTCTRASNNGSRLWACSAPPTRGTSFSSSSASARSTSSSSSIVSSRYGSSSARVRSGPSAAATTVSSRTDCNRTSGSMCLRLSMIWASSATEYVLPSSVVSMGSGAPPLPAAAEPAMVTIPAPPTGSSLEAICTSLMVAVVAAITHKTAAPTTRTRLTRPRPRPALFPLVLPPCCCFVVRGRWAGPCFRPLSERTQHYRALLHPLSAGEGVA
eukprot:m.104242 g.104242  ORF g.104242 m.104242 type:complete len:345 (-) comp15635_c0_seq1:304-1338(-)